jgi:L-lactate dehydrogenase complex protein LldE
MRISLFITCYNDTLFPEIVIAVVRVLERLGHTIDFPYAQTCCGQMHCNTVYQSEALPMVRRFVEVFRRSDVRRSRVLDCVIVV